ncbi:hypothetical protein QPK87_09500 [Kamptonema cortianum]|nr:hypothetical protein [Kamptonema cortianum]
MKRRFSLSITLICAGIIAPFSASPVSAVETVKISHERYEEFVTGKADGVTLTQDGTIILSPALKKLTDLSSDYLWDAVYDANGNLYVATGDKGKVWKITPDGQASEFFKGEGVNVFAIAMNKKGQLHIATSPDGKVLRLDTNGQSTVYFDCKEKKYFRTAFR